MEDFYEINVATKREGKCPEHYCKIKLPGGIMTHEAVAQFNELKEIFGEDYELSLMYWECRGYEIGGE